MTYLPPRKAPLFWSILCWLPLAVRSLQDGAIVPSDLFTSQKGTPLLVYPMLATLGNRPGSLQDGAIVPSDLMTSQKSTPLQVHPMLHPNIDSPRDAATPAFCFCFLHLPSMGGNSNGVTHINFLLVWSRSQIIVAGTVRSVPPLYGRRFNMLNCTAAVSAKYRSYNSSVN